MDGVPDDVEEVRLEDPEGVVAREQVEVVPVCYNRLEVLVVQSDVEGLPDVVGVQCGALVSARDGESCRLRSWSPG